MSVSNDLSKNILPDGGSKRRNLVELIIVYERIETILQYERPVVY